MTEITKTLKLRVKDKHRAFLNSQAREVNFVWNYVNDLCYKHLQRKGKFLSAFDIHQYTTGTKGLLSLSSATVQNINEEYVTRRKQFKKSKLKWRSSQGSKKSLGWIPFKKANIKYKNGQILYQSKHISVWDSYGLSQYDIGTGSFNEDSRGRWYINVTVKVKVAQSTGTNSVGIDLGCKESATTSTGQTLTGKQYRALEEKLGKAQRANKKHLVRAIHAKIKNRRKDEQHKFTTNLVKNNAAIFVGNVSSNKLTQTTMAKSVLDAGWHQLKTMLEYKCHQAGVVFEEVDEAYTTQSCSHCGSISQSSPKGRAGLGIRQWTCNECGITHDRDVNAAKNILNAGHTLLAGGVPPVIKKARRVPKSRQGIAVSQEESPAFRHGEGVNKLDQIPTLAKGKITEKEFAVCTGNIWVPNG